MTYEEQWDTLNALGFCGCFEECFLEMVYTALVRLSSEPHENTDIRYTTQKEDPKGDHTAYTYFVLATLERADLIEHGGSARWSWLTEKGHIFLKWVHEHGFDPDKWPTGEEDKV